MTGQGQCRGPGVLRGAGGGSQGQGVPGMLGGAQECVWGSQGGLREPAGALI